MTYRPIFPIKIHRIALVDPLKNLRKRSLSRLYEQMNMIDHQNIGIQGILISDLVVSEYLEITLMVFYVFEYPLPLVPTGNYVVKGSLIFDSRLPCHTQRLSVRPIY